jgi:hypothetical protein
MHVASIKKQHKLQLESFGDNHFKASIHPKILEFALYLEFVYNDGS